jgi:hypothetical protein
MLGRNALLIAATACGFGKVEMQANCMAYEPEIVRLGGVLTIQEKYGPPNYGETPSIDQRVDVPILRLSRPVDVCADPRSEVNVESFSKIIEVQLVFSAAGQRYENYAGRDVVVTGTLSQALTGRQYTKVVLTVRTIGPP